MLLLFAAAAANADSGVANLPLGVGSEIYAVKDFLVPVQMQGGDPRRRTVFFSRQFDGTHSKYKNGMAIISEAEFLKENVIGHACSMEINLRENESGTFRIAHGQSYRVVQKKPAVPAAAKGEFAFAQGAAEFTLVPITQLADQAKGEGTPILLKCFWRGNYETKSWVGTDPETRFLIQVLNGKFSGTTRPDVIPAPASQPGGGKSTPAG